MTHVEVFLCLDILGKGSVFCDPNAPHPTLAMPGGAIADFLTHLASLAYAFVGPHRSCWSSWSKRSPSPLPSDEFRALIEAERGTASLGFSGNTRPDAFWLRVYGTKMQAVANLFETRLTVDRLRGGPRPLMPLRNALDESKAVRRAAFGSLKRKLSGGPGAYEGLWELLSRTYKALEDGSEPPVPSRQVVAVNRLVADLAAGAESVVKAMITGANGFLGRHVVAEFLRRGHAVKALVRPATRLDGLDWADRVEVFRADLRASKNLADAFDGVDVLVHLAAAVTGGEDAQFAATVVGTERLLDAMRSTPTRRLVLASSFSVYAWSKIRGTLDESSPVEQGDDLYLRDGYAISKVWQERVARRLSGENHWDLTVLRPGFIWGRGNEYLAGLGQKVGRHHLVFGPGSQLPLTHVENCADFFATAAENPRAVGEAFNVVDGDGARIGEYLAEHMRRSGEGGLRVPIPYGLGMAAARTAQGISRLVFRGKGKLPSILVPRRFEARFKPLNYTNEKARRLLGWRPPLGVEECLRKTYDEGVSGDRDSAAPRPEEALTR